MLRGVKDYVRAASLEDAVRVLAERNGSVDILAGGTDLLLVDHGYDTLLDISRLDLAYVREEGEWLRIGATTSIETIMRSEVVRAFADGILCESCRIFGTLQIRNMATIGGNVANAMPAADPPSALLALDAEVVLVAAGAAERVVPLDRFYTGPRKTVRKPTELIREIRIPRAMRAWRGRWLKVGRVFRDIALVNCGVSVRLGGGDRGAAGSAGGGGVVEDARIAFCAVAPTAIRVREAEEILRGVKPTPALLADIVMAVQRGVRPISDHRASESYRRHVSGVLARRALADICGVREG
jgi:carbon-monoxide dehydrogenase medium subunit